MSELQTRAMTHLDYLCNTIGERVAGSPAHKRAEAYIRDVFQRHELHIEDVNCDFPDWTLNNAQLTVNGQAFVIDVNPFSPACEVNAPIVAVSTLPELEEANITNTCVLLYGELSKSPVFPINFEPIQFERDQAINRLLMEKAPSAVLAINLHPWRRLHIFEDEDFPLPSATVNVEVGRELLGLQGENAHLSINTTTEASQVTTIVGRTNTGKAHRVALMAHYDTKVGTVGAHDNGTGVASLLALVETLTVRDLPFDLEFVAFADEEYGAHTDGVYTRKTGDDFAKMLCAFNIDGIGLLTENTTITMLAQGEIFENCVRDIQGNYPSIVWVDPWVQSNHYTYFAQGVPCVAFSSLTWERAHQASDTVDWIGADKLAETIALTTDIISALSDRTPDWTRSS